MSEEDLLNPRVRHAWVAPLLSTLLTLPAAGFALLYGGLSPMACDSCDGAEADRFTESFDAAWAVLCAGLLLSMAVLLASWVLPWRQRHVPTRALLSVAAPGTVLVAFIAFMTVVDRP
ncbi:MULTISPECIES: hypothetical protein [Streptomyces]|uniref:Integral membrane protein n=1 Tax=Streptomyces flavovirens TaxID=52258 RepID=A0ABV8N9H9_9ACTN|nr:hypothetical protein [Streptomyces sp. MBT51]MBK3591029.1 hypothetical protein [Streptomyces sp. MBT51]